MKSYSKPTSEQLNRTLPLVSSPEHETYFFARLENPNWVKPLRDQGFFAHPPKAERVPGGGIRYPIWGPSEYLARMASYVPSEVATIFSGLETDNASVVRDVLKAALAMPPTEAAKLVPVIRLAARSGTLWFGFKDATKLCVLLTEGKKASAAMKLAEALFAPRFGEGQETPKGQNRYWYQDGLKKVIPVLAVHKPRPFLRKLCHWLKVTVDAKKYVDPELGTDYSYSWRPAVEEHGENRDYDFAGIMVGFVRRGFEEAIGEGKLPLGDALEIIDAYTYLIFKRIRVYLINEFAEQNRSLACQVMMDRNLFDDYRYKHEYAKLVGRRLDLLTDEERGTWFSWVDAGPKPSDRDATKEVYEQRKRYWQFEKLHLVRKFLDGDKLQFYEEILKEHGDPDMADLNFPSGPVGWGHKSPMTLNDLARMTFEEVVERVSAWKGKDSGFMGPSIEGLGATFGQYVKKNPEAYSGKAGVLKNRPATYVREFIRQMGDAAKANRELKVVSVLKLCQWVVEQPVGERTTPKQEVDGLVDPDWQWTRDEISQFIQYACRAMVDGAPRYPLKDLRKPMWAIIEALYRDPAKSNIVHDYAKDDPRVRDYLDLGINSPRGKAVGAGLDYARWVANHVIAKKGEAESVASPAEEMPGVWEMLDWQVSGGNRSVEALAVIGAHIRLIYWLNKDWLAANAERLFELEGFEKDPVRREGWAAWNAFLVWNRPHTEFYKLFQNQFDCAVRQAALVELPDRTDHQPMNFLGEHLMILYGRGEFDLDDDKGLLSRFLSDAKPDIRRHAIGFVGRSLENVDLEIQGDVVDRLQGLWKTYWDRAGKQDAKERPDADLFGPWFTCGKFPARWSLEQLEKYVEVAPTPEPNHAIVEQLAEIAETDILRSVRILDQMIRGDREGWRTDSWVESIRRILEEGMRSGGDARKESERTINDLGRRGYTEFGDLLGVYG